MKRLAVMGMLLLGTMLFSASGAFALHPELSIPEKVEVKHKACQEIKRLSDKYQVDGLYSREFTAGEVCYTRTDIAVALVILTEKMAEKAEKEGAAAVDKEDLLLISDLQEELRGEMLLARSRAFQSRYGDLGTRFQALTKNISLSGGLVGVVQGSLNNEPRNHGDVVGRGDLVFNFRVGDNTIAVIDVEATGGDGLDARIPSFSLLNGVAGSTGDRVRLREAWVEHAAFNDRLVMTAGKIDLTNYFDANAVANDENSQFLAGAFVNSAVLGAPAVGPGVRIQAKPAEPLVFGIGYGSGDGDSDDTFEHGFGIAELAYKVKVGDLEGNYRLYGCYDGALPDGSIKLARRNAFGFGVSLDQQLTGKLTLFGRYGQRDKDVYVTKRAWSAGLQYVGPIPSRKDDVLALAYGQIEAAGASSQEKLAELYYGIKVSDQIAVTPVVQYLVNPEGNSARENVVVVALRSQISF